jgi:hypothetical protein
MFHIVFPCRCQGGCNARHIAEALFPCVAQLVLFRLLTALYGAHECQCLAEGQLIARIFESPAILIRESVNQIEKPAVAGIKTQFTQPFAVFF